MHRVVQEQIEKIMNSAGTGLSSSSNSSLTAAREHMAGCADCRDELSGMEEQAILLRALRVPESFDAEPRAGFYARVMERIEAEGPVSIWNLFMESTFGRRIAFASLALAVLLGGYLISTERTADDPILAGNPAVPAEQGQFVLSQEGGNGQLVMGLPEGVALMDPFAQQPRLDSFPVATGAAVRLTQAAPDEDAVLSTLMGYREQ